MKKKIIVLIITLASAMSAQYSFTKHDLSNSLFSAQNIISSDIDSDGDLDILSAGEALIWWENNNSITDFEEHVITDSSGEMITARTCDINNDSFVDIIVSKNEQQEISVWFNDGNQNFSEQVVQTDFAGAHDALAEDMNNDGLEDIIASRGDPDGNGEIIYLIQNSDGGFDKQTIYEGDFCHSIDVADLNGDSKPDITSTHINEGIRVFIQGTDNTFDEQLFTVPQPHFVRTCDIDDDGDIDILCAALAFGVCLLENQTDGNFVRSFPISNYALFLYPADINGDGRKDILLSDLNSKSFRIFEHQEDGSFSKKTLPGLYRGVSGVCVSDIDGDSDPDLLTTCWKSTRKIEVWENLNVVNDNEINVLPNEFSLNQNYPNPFNPSTTITYNIPVDDALSSLNVPVTLKIYDILGNEITTLQNGPQSPGYYEHVWNAEDISSGIYMYVLKAGRYLKSNKMILLK